MESKSEKPNITKLASNLSESEPPADGICNFLAQFDFGQFLAAITSGVILLNSQLDIIASNSKALQLLGCMEQEELHDRLLNEEFQKAKLLTQLTPEQEEIYWSEFRKPRSQHQSIFKHEAKDAKAAYNLTFRESEEFKFEEGNPAPEQAEHMAGSQKILHNITIGSYLRLLPKLQMDKEQHLQLLLKKNVECTN